MPTHDETSPVAPRAGSVRRPPPARTRSTGGGGAARKPAPGGRARTTASRSGAPTAGGSGRPPGSRNGGGTRTGGGGSRGGGSGGPRKNTKGKAPRSKKQGRRRRLKIAAGVLTGMLVLLGVFVGVVYASTEVPSPDSVQNAQTTIVYYADGKTEMARLGSENRTNVTLDQISQPAQNAVLAAENRSFYTDPGISFTGILRAAWSNVSGGSTQGGSTITQQYVKNAFLTSDQTFSRKFKELFLAIKLDNNFSKKQILENYLNTIYFGRGAYGIEAAANTYFGVPAAKLTAQQGAVLAVLIRSPSRYDPAANPNDAADRWGKVLDAMVHEGWLAKAERAASTYPPVLKKSGSSLGMPTRPEGLIVDHAIKELVAKGYDEQQVYAGGLRITTTVDKHAQDVAVASVNQVMDGQPETLRQALIAVDPKTGGVRAYYGGKSGVGNDYGLAQRQPGSSMKPYVLATALEQGISVTARRDGSDDQVFQDRPGRPVTNSGNASCSSCTLQEALVRSLNTTFYGLAYEVGPDNVADMARRATGLPKTWKNGKETLTSSTGGRGGSIGIGEYEMRPIDQANGMATLAAGGIHRNAYFVAKVTDSAGGVLLENRGEPGEQVIAPDVASDVAYAMEGVAEHAKRTLDGGREVACKTGTQGYGGDASQNTDAWMVGFTPSIAAAVWMGSDELGPIQTVDGAAIFGSGLPGAIWQSFMDGVLDGTPQENLPDEPLIDGDTGEGVPAPTQEPVPTTAPVTAAPTTKAPVTTPPSSSSAPPSSSSASESSSSSASSSASSSPAQPASSPPLPPKPNGGEPPT
ncbi:MAG: Peptidoglycan glycosyltransferase [Blastococcus sp.]|nr:Peptidoglycan glycosyltransferase [Blastococcus sp.]